MSTSVVVVIPFYKKALDAYESISVHRTLEALSDQADIVFCGPSQLPLDDIDFQLDIDYSRVHELTHFDDRYFRSPDAYNALLLSPRFYETFDQYEYLLIAQHDCFVFGNDLEPWCKAEYDYIGAPWWEGWENPPPDADFIGVGNGGLSLRRIDSALKVLYTFKYIKSPKLLIGKYLNSKIKFRDLVSKMTVENNTFYLINESSKNEDIFWGKVAESLFQWYKVPDPTEALSFSFEVKPKELYQLNNCSLPFGCHAWREHSPEFWVPKIKKMGYDI